MVNVQAESTDELLREWYAIDALPEQQTNEYANGHNLATNAIWQALTGERDAPGTWVMSEAQSEAQSAAQEREDLAWKRYSDMKRKGKRVK